jgi:UDP-N-acetylmuramyl pentapeptide synthase
MLRRFKRALYFPVAQYFRFWARIQLKRWNPRVILVTGSSGKTTLLHLLESQMGSAAHYSHKANSAFGLSFDILNIIPKGTGKLEWFGLFLKTPFAAFHEPYPAKFYIAEADSDRPGEAAFIGQLLNPEVVVWLSSDLSHSHNFDHSGGGKVDQAIALEFGTYLAAASKLGVINGDSKNIIAQTHRTSAAIQSVSGSDISGYRVTPGATEFKIGGKIYSVPALLPEEAGLSVASVKIVCDYLNIPVDADFGLFVPPPGRSSIFSGIKGTMLIDSTYNAIPDAVRAVLNLFAHYPAKTKWLVLGDMVEQGVSERLEHEKLAAEIFKLKPARIILVGPRVQQYTAPKLLELAGTQLNISTFTKPRQALEYLLNEISGGETILFKGAGFLEGVVEKLLKNPEDAVKLCKRELVWKKRRAQWDL